MDRLFQLFTLLFFQASCQTNPLQDIYHPKREFRAVWIVTLDNKDFPSRPGLTSEEQKQELIDILDYHQRKGINAIFFQVRPSADAFYSSAKEPWSEWLTGKQGVAPQAFYDPLQFVIEECHQRNMELHAWFNPYRAVFSKEKSNIHPLHISNRQPHWVIEYGNGLHFNPGIPQVRQYVVDVVMDVVKRYDIDGVHFDDYFYPYTSKGKDFPDEETYRYFNQGKFTNKGDWRRDNINQLIKEVHEKIKKTKPFIKFGISPLGVWRNKSDDSRGSPTFVGQTAYDYLGADALKWLSEGWIDYIAPQLYWSIGHKNADYQTLTDWWAKNSYGRHLYIGHALFKIDNDDDQRWKNPSEIPNQLRINRTFTQISGSIFFRAKSMMENTHYIADTLKNHFYKYPALIPPMPWKDATPPLPPSKPRSIRTRNRIILKWDTPEKATDGDLPVYYVVYKFEKKNVWDINSSQHIVSIQKGRTFYEKITIDSKEEYVYLITSIDRLHNESTPAFVE